MMNIMIQLKAHPGYEFLESTKEYPTRPGKRDQEMIQWIEDQIKSRSQYFLSDPEDLVDRWESLTGCEIPPHYIDDLPVEIVSILSKGKGMPRSNQFSVSLLPVMDSLGKAISYDSERLVADFLKFNQKVYVLKDTLYKQLASA